MKKERTYYDKAFKENAVKLSFERKNVSELAHELGVDPLLLYRWRKEYQEKYPLMAQECQIFSSSFRR